MQGYASGVFWQGFGAFFTPIVDAFGWSRGATAAALSFQRVESGSISPFVGIALDKFGPRKLMSFGLFVTGLGFIIMSQMQELWHFYAAMALLTFGMSFGTFITIVATVGNWFVRKRSRAIGLLMSASAVGGLSVPLLVWFVDAVGWREALFAVGVGFWVIGIPAIIVIVRRPEDKGLLPDGDRSPGQTGGRSGLHRPVRENQIPVMAALKTRFFWQLAIGTSLGHLVSSTTLLHIDAMQTFGISRTTAGLAIFGFAVGSFFGRLAMGFIGDYFDKRYLMAISFNMQILGVLGLASLNASVGGVFLGQWGLLFYAVFFGVGFGGGIPVRMAMIGDYFGRRTYGSMLGIMSTVNAVLGASGPIFVGVMFDVTGTYRTPFLLLIVLLLASGPLMWTLEKPSRVQARFRMSASRAVAEAAGAARSRA